MKLSALMAPVAATSMILMLAIGLHQAVLRVGRSSVRQSIEVLRLHEELLRRGRCGDDCPHRARVDGAERAQTRPDARAALATPEKPADAVRLAPPGTDFLVVKPAH